MRLQVIDTNKQDSVIFTTTFKSEYADNLKSPLSLLVKMVWWICVLCPVTEERKRSRKMRWEGEKKREGEKAERRGEEMEKGSQYQIGLN